MRHTLYTDDGCVDCLRCVLKTIFIVQRPRSGNLKLAIVAAIGNLAVSGRGNVVDFITTTVIAKQSKVKAKMIADQLN